MSSGCLLLFNPSEEDALSTFLSAHGLHSSTVSHAALIHVPSSKRRINPKPSKEEELLIEVKNREVLQFRYNPVRKDRK